MSRSYIEEVGFQLPFIFDMTIEAPLDNRVVVDALDDLNCDSGVFNNSAYVGMVVFVKETPYSLWCLIDIEKEGNTHLKYTWLEFKNDLTNVVDTKEDLDLIPRPYDGMVVYVKSEKHSLWVFNGDVEDDSESSEESGNWHEFKDWCELKKELDSINAQVGESLQEKLEGLQEQIDELKDWIETNKQPQLYFTYDKDDEGNVNLKMNYDKSKMMSDNISYNDDNKSLVISEGTKEDWSRKIMIFDRQNKTLKIVEDN